MADKNKKFDRPNELYNINVSQQFRKKADEILKVSFLNYQKQAIGALNWAIASYIEWLKALSCQQRINELRSYYSKKAFLESLSNFENIFQKKELKAISDELFDKLDKYGSMLLKKLPELTEKEYTKLSKQGIICFYKYHFEHVENVQKIKTSQILSNLISFQDLKNHFNLN